MSPTPQVDEFLVEIEGHQVTLLPFTPEMQFRNHHKVTIETRKRFSRLEKAFTIRDATATISSRHGEMTQTIHTMKMDTDGKFFEFIGSVKEWLAINVFNIKHEQKAG